MSRLVAFSLTWIDQYHRKDVAELLLRFRTYFSYRSSSKSSSMDANLLAFFCESHTSKRNWSWGSVFVPMLTNSPFHVFRRNQFQPMNVRLRNKYQLILFIQLVLLHRIAHYVRMVQNLLVLKRYLSFVTIIKRISSAMPFVSDVYWEWKLIFLWLRFLLHPMVEASERTFVLNLVFCLCS